MDPDLLLVGKVLNNNTGCKWFSLHSLASAHPRNFLLNSQAHLGVGEDLTRCHHGWPEWENFWRFGVLDCQKWYLQRHMMADCTKLFPDHTKCQHVQNYLLTVGRYYLYICQLSLHTCNFCKISLHARTPEILSCTPEISSKTAILCSLVNG